jgi:hypothetical protein
MSTITEGWNSISGAILLPKRSVVAVSDNPRWIDLFAIDGNGQVYTAWWHDEDPFHWNGWNRIDPGGPPSPPKQSVVAVSDNPRWIDLFAIGNDGQVYVAWWHEPGPWQGWNRIDPGGPPSPPKKSVVAVSTNPRWMDLFAIGNDGEVYTAWWHGGNPWYGWEAVKPSSPQHYPKQSVVAISVNPRWMDLFAIPSPWGEVITAWGHPAPPTVRLTAIPDRIMQGQSTMLSWSSQNATALDLEPGVGSVPAGGSRNVSPQSTTTYNITATGSLGTASATALVSVAEPPPPPPTSQYSVALLWKPGSPEYVQSDPIYASPTSKVLKVGNKNPPLHRCSLLFPNHYLLNDGQEATPAQLGLSDVMLGMVITAIPSPLDGQQGQWDIWVQLTYTT